MNLWKKRMIVVTKEDELSWNPEKRYKMENEKEIEPTVLTGDYGDIVEARDGTKYRITSEGSFKKL